MKIAFAGTSAFAAPILEALIGDPRFQPVLVYTQPARPAGRGMAVRPGPVEEIALRTGTTLRTPVSWDTREIEILRTSGAEVLVTAAYGLLLPDAALHACPRSAVNVHGSLLPRWRGAAPIQRAIEAGDPESGVTLFRITPGPVDSGPVFSRFTIPISPRETSASLSERLARLAAERIGDELQAWAAGERPELAQDPAGVTRARKLRKDESHLAWTLNALTLDRRVRAFTPWPGARIGTLRILELRPVNRPGDGARRVDPGTVLATRPLVVSCGDGTDAVELVSVQRDGGRPQPGGDWANGARVAVGSRMP